MKSYHKSLIMDLAKTSAGDELKTLTDPHVLLGFSELQISQVMHNLHKLFTIDDVCSTVEIWHLKHAYKILEILSQVYGDVGEIEHFSDDQDEYDIELDDFNEEWDELLNDDSLFERAIENMSLS